MRFSEIMVALAALPLPALAQEGTASSDRANTILVTATGVVETAPDIATVSLTIRGEGKTPDAAAAALAAKQTAIFAGLRRLDSKAEVRTGSIELRELRKGNCSNREFGEDTLASAVEMLELAADGTSSDGQSSKGPCVVVGASAETNATVILASIKDAGTAVGLAGRLGASASKIESFGLRDDSIANRQALSTAIEHARRQAEAIAVASNAKLRPLVSVVDVEARDRARYTSNAAAMTMFDVASPVVTPPPIVINIFPTPVETRVQLLVTFTLIP